jgi:hypothetical protein
MKVSDHGLVLAACGNAAATGALLAGAAPALATRLGLSPRQLAPADQPQRALATLAEASGWLAALPLDPGLPLAGGGHWAEALGAWRQPTLLLLDAAQLDTGLPAAATALLESWRVPLVGLIQWGPAASWHEEARRGDGLPWLGWLDPAGEAGESLVPALRLRWQACLSARR